MKLRDWRRAEKLTIDEAAARFGVSKDTLYRWEQGKLLPRRKTIDRIVAATGGRVGGADFFEPANVNAGTSVDEAA